MNLGEVVECRHPHDGKLERGRIVSRTKGTELKVWVHFENRGFDVHCLPVSSLYVNRLGDRLKYLPGCGECRAQETQERVSALSRLRTLWITRKHFDVWRLNPNDHFKLTGRKRPIRFGGVWIKPDMSIPVGRISYQGYFTEELNYGRTKNELRRTTSCDCDATQMSDVRGRR